MNRRGYGEEHQQVLALEGLERRLMGEGRWSAGPATMFAALKLTGNEVLHCRMLAWLLDPLAPHGLGVKIVGDLLDHIAASGSEVVLPAERQIERTRLVTEEARGATRADLILYGTGWTVVIEAKLTAGEQPTQGERLATGWPDAILVYLTPGGRAMKTAGAAEWIPLRWAAIWTMVRDAYEAAREPGTANAATARCAVRDYLIATRTLEQTNP
jgi:hypothetical protein